MISEHWLVVMVNKDKPLVQETRSTFAVSRAGFVADYSWKFIIGAQFIISTH